jgi:hypothetical protein
MNTESEIDRLEKILNSEDPTPVHITPDGRVVSIHPVTTNIFQELHDSEINGRISSFFDGSWRVELGDEMNGFVDDDDASTYAEAEAALARMAIKRYPDSAFAKKRAA